MLPQGPTFSENWVRIVILCINETEMIILARFRNSNVESASLKALRTDPFRRNISHVELFCWIRAVSVESTLAV